MTRNDVKGTGSHVIWSGKTADQWEKGWWAQDGEKPLTSHKMDHGLRGHVIWDGKPLTSWEKGWRAQIKKREDIS